MKAPAPLLVGADNCRAVLGVDWCTAKRWAAERGVPFVRPSKRKVLVRADLLLAALEANLNTCTQEPEADPRTEVLRALGRSA